MGNLTVGGTGKTPTTLWLAQALKKNGFRVAILSRGYKRTAGATVILDPGLSRVVSGEGGAENAIDAGDEPFMMAKLYSHKVGVGKKRYEAGNQILQSEHVDVFILDDGFQHRQLSRDIDLVLLGLEHKGWLMPAGPFREPRGVLRRADLCLVTGAREEWGAFLAGRQEKSAVFFGSLRPKVLVSWEGEQWQEASLGLLVGKKIVAVSGIASAAPFYRMIHDWEGEILDTVEFSDHHTYSAEDWQRINRAARHADLIITTEKDIFKLMRFPFAKKQLLALRVEMVVENGCALIKCVADAVRAKMRDA